MPASDDKLLQHQRLRNLKDSLAALVVRTGGISVIIAICLIFLFLLWEVIPLFRDAKIRKVNEYVLPGSKSPTLLLAMEEQLQTATRVTRDGKVHFFHASTGRLLQSFKIKLPAGSHITAFFRTEPDKGFNDEMKKKRSKEVYILGLNNGTALVVRHYYKESYDKAVKTRVKRIITPMVDFPFGEEPIKLHKDGSPVVRVTGEWDEDNLTLASLSENNKITVTALERNTMAEDGVRYESSSQVVIDGLQGKITRLLMNKNQDKLFVLNEKSGLSFYNLRNKEKPALVEHIPTLDNKAQVSTLRFLIGGSSFIIGLTDGRIVQWHVQNKTWKLKKLREFRTQRTPIVSLAAEYRRKGFLAIDSKGVLGVYHSTTEQNLLTRKVSKFPLRSLWISPRANAALIETGKNSIQFWYIKNPHADASLSVLASTVEYEGYEKAGYTWQSSASTDDFEPKFSLVPLTFGTLKAAFYAMLISIPLAIMGAIFTAHFMTPGMRKVVKPGIEIMEALPTVIIGFMAGIWLAPVLAANLAGVFLILLTLPFGIVLASFYWERLPARYRSLVPEGWEALLLIPVVLLTGWFTFAVLGPAIEFTFFKGSLSHYLSDVWKIPYQQRNSLVVGIAMGFAVIPTIFSIAEDAIFAVPKHLVQGSLALGATQWQTLTRVVLLTASPGIFSAVMIGFGRAVGETMIVLMATGNTPVMDPSPFQGFRTLSANIAVEMPESEEHSTHFRILFLAALVLFAFTFLFNTIAEVVRQRLRTKYSTL